MTEPENVTIATIDDIPPSLLMAVHVWLDDPKQFVSAPGTEELRNLLNGRATWVDVQEPMGIWLEERTALFEDLAEVQAMLLEAEPLDDLDNMPAWPWTWWGQLLNESWAEDLPTAIAAAKVYLSEL